MSGWEMQEECCQKRTKDLRTVSGPCRHFADLSLLLSEGENLTGFEQTLVRIISREKDDWLLNWD